MSDQISEVYDIPKYILKKTYENTLPKEIIYRKKMGFPVPLNAWFGGNFIKYAKKILLSKEASTRGFFSMTILFSVNCEKLFILLFIYSAI